MGANIAGIYGAQIFRSDDKPRYRRAFAVACAILAFGLLVAIIRYVDDKIKKRRKARQIEDASSVDSDHSVPLPPSQVTPTPVMEGRRPSI